MNDKKKLITVVVLIVCCIIVIWFSTTSLGGPKTYEIQPKISVPGYKTDAVRAIDAYERLMERYMNMTDRNSARIDSDLKQIIRQLDVINDKLTRLSLRIARIEKTFGIEEPKLPDNKKHRPKIPENKAPAESFPIW